MEDHPKLCPFFGTLAVPTAAKSFEAIARPGTVSIDIKMFQCRKQECMFWHGEKNDCLVKLGLEALIPKNLEGK